MECCIIYFCPNLRFPGLQFQYKDPEKNFDRSKVHGLVAKLVKVKDPQNATALEVAAGGKARYFPAHLYENQIKIL